MATIICYDAGFVNLGYMVAELPESPDLRPKPIHLGVSSAPLPKKPDPFRRKPVTHQNIHRILTQVKMVKRLHRQYRPVGYFIEMPHGGAKGALAIRGMAFATAYLAATIHTLAPRAGFTTFSPGHVKKVVTGNRNASKLEVARGVIAYWPEIGDWPGFKVIAKKKVRKGKQVVEQDKAIAHDATDAGAVCIAAMQDDSYLDFFYGEENPCLNSLDLDLVP